MARERLDDIRELEPTSNSELRDRWGMDTTKDVARYLREELGEYTYRDNNSKICANAAEPDTADETPEEPDTDTSEPASDDFTEVPIADDPETISDDPEEDSVAGESGEPPLETDTPGHTHSGESSDKAAAQTDTADTLSIPSSGSQTTDSDTSTPSTEPCPECGASLDYARERLPFFATDGDVWTVEPGDGICDRCDLVVADDGDVIYEINSDKAPPIPPCSKCDGAMIGPGHAKYLLTVYYENKSSLDVFGRRRLKKIARHIEKTDANYVCPSCWTSYA